MAESNKLPPLGSDIQNFHEWEQERNAGITKEQGDKAAALGAELVEQDHAKKRAARAGKPAAESSNSRLEISGAMWVLILFFLFCCGGLTYLSLVFVHVLPRPF